MYVFTVICGVLWPLGLPFYDRCKRYITRRMKQGNLPNDKYRWIKTRMNKQLEARKDKKVRQKDWAGRRKYSTSPISTDKATVSIRPMQLRSIPSSQLTGTQERGILWLQVLVTGSEVEVLPTLSSAHKLQDGELRLKWTCVSHIPHLLPRYNEC